MSTNKRLKTDHDIVNEVGNEDNFILDDEFDIEDIDLSAIIEAEKQAKALFSKRKVAVETSKAIATDQTQSARNTNVYHAAESPKVKRKKFSRFLVANVTHGQYTIDEDTFSEKILVLSAEETNSSVVARLRQDWKQTIVGVGDVIHIPYIADAKEITIDNESNFIIIHPDQLISCTAVADSFACLRKSVMQMKVKGASEYNEALVHGNIIHRVLQKGLQTGDFSIKSLRDELISVIQNSLEDLYAIGQDEKIAMAVLSNFLESMHTFGTTYVSDEPKPNAQMSTDMGSNAAQELKCSTIAISKVLDIEEHLWSPTYGLKGLIDASIQLKLHPTNRVLTVPFELKTGKTTRFLANRAQTLLYTLMMSDRYDVDVHAGVLYYSKTNSLYVIPGARTDIRSLLMARNELAVAVKQKTSLPSMLKDVRTCQYCFLNDTCIIYHKAIENGTGETSGLQKLFKEKTDHLTDASCSFFKHWWQLLEKEENNIDYIRKDIWSQPADIREMNGRCLSNMIINVRACEIDLEKSRWKYTFVRSQSKQDQPLLCNMNPGDPVVVSSMDGHINLAMGFIVAITSLEIVLSLSEPLRNPPQACVDFNPEDNQNFYSFVQVESNLESYYGRSHIEYRIDKDDMATGLNLLRHNLVMLATKDNNNDRMQRLRELIIDLEKPIYNTMAPNLPPTPHMNPDQRNALKHVLRAKDYSLILGMPGTGKTTTTAEIIKYLVSQNKTVLVAAYTHSALDNILHKVREQGIELLRLGNIDKVMPSIRDCVPSANSTIKTVEELKQYYESRKVVGVTCLGIGHVILQQRVFDYCIIDEASQITLPTCIGPLRYAKTFVLVGDSYQLPPIVHNKEALEYGLDKSLFTKLAEARPEAVTYLEYQYRMSKDIMDVSNLLIYDGKMKCGNQRVASRTLHIPTFEAGLQSIHRDTPACPSSSGCWLRNILSPSRRVVFVNTDKLSGKESRPFGSFLQNDTEATLVQQVAEALVRCGVTAEQLAVVSPYRTQVRILANLLYNRPGIEVATIDRYQGRDKECVLLSLVRNNEQGNAGDLLRDWRRLNVAITRAKSKLILFGSTSTLKGTAIYSDIIQHFEKKGWVYELAEEADKQHAITTNDENRNPNGHVPSTAAKSPKSILPTNAVLRKSNVLNDIYQETT